MWARRDDILVVWEPICKFLQFLLKCFSIFCTNLIEPIQQKQAFTSFQQGLQMSTRHSRTKIVNLGIKIVKQGFAVDIIIF